MKVYVISVEWINILKGNYSIREVTGIKKKMVKGEKKKNWE